MAAQPKITKFFTTREQNGRPSLGHHVEEQHTLRDIHSKLNETNKVVDDNYEDNSLEYIQVDVDPADIICNRDIDEPTSVKSSESRDDVDPEETFIVEESCEILQDFTQAKKTPSRVVLFSRRGRSTKAAAKVRSPVKKTPSRRRKLPPHSEPPSPSASQSSDVTIEDGIIGMKVRSPTNIALSCHRKT